MSRVDLHPGWVLHRRPWRESSLLIELLTPEYGRLALVARGARGARSPWRGLAEPFIPLQASWLRRGEMGTLTALEPIGDSTRLAGRSLWCGLYVNELVIRLTARDDPSPELFTLYGKVMLQLTDSERLGVALRRFELGLLDLLGIMPDLAHEANGGGAISPQGIYRLDPDLGALPATDRTGQVFEGKLLLGLAQGEIADQEVADRAKPITRLLIDRQLGGQPLHTRRLFH